MKHNHKKRIGNPNCPWRNFSLFISTQGRDESFNSYISAYWDAVKDIEAHSLKGVGNTNRLSHSFETYYIAIPGCAGSFTFYIAACWAQEYMEDRVEMPKW